MQHQPINMEGQWYILTPPTWCMGGYHVTCSGPCLCLASHVLWLVLNILYLVLNFPYPISRVLCPLSHIQCHVIQVLELLHIGPLVHKHGHGLEYGQCCKQGCTLVQ